MRYNVLQKSLDPHIHAYTYMYIHIFGINFEYESSEVVERDNKMH